MLIFKTLVPSGKTRLFSKVVLINGGILRSLSKYKLATTRVHVPPSLCLLYQDPHQGNQPPRCLIVTMGMQNIQQDIDGPIHIVNSEIFARVLFLRNFAYV